MTDLHERFREYDEVPVPDLWERISDLADEPTAAQSTRPRFLTAVATSLVVLLAVGGPLLWIGSQDSTNPDESAVAGWDAVPADPPWDAAPVDAIQLTNGGFVVLVSEPAGIRWSPDGAAWFDIDPDDQVPRFVPSDADDESRPATLAAVGDGVAVLDRANVAVWVSDRTTGTWEKTPLETGSAPGLVDLFAMVSDQDQLLVLGRVRGTDTIQDPEFELAVTSEYATWVISPADGTTTQSSRPIVGPEWAEPDTTDAVSYDGRWVALVRRTVWNGDEGWDSRVSIVESPDGVTWTMSDPPEGWGSVTSFTAGPSSVIVTTCHFGGDDVWYSPDGVSWNRSISAGISHQSAYVDGMGFVAHGGNLWMSSAEGRHWQSAAASDFTIEPYPAAGERLAAIEETPFIYDNRLWIWSQE